MKPSQFQKKSLYLFLLNHRSRLRNICLILWRIMNIIPYLSALHAATLMFILQKINSVRSLSVFVWRSDYCLCLNLNMMAIHQNQNCTRILLSVLIQSNQTKLSCFPYILYEILEKRNTSRTVRSATIKTRSYNTWFYNSSKVK